MKKYFVYICVSFLFSSVVSCEKKPDLDNIGNNGDKSADAWSHSFDKVKTYLRILENVKQLKNAYDFNGDGLKDYLYFSTVIPGAGNLPENIELMHLKDGVTQIRNLDSGASNAIVIVHGGIEKVLIIHDRQGGNVSLLDSPIIWDSYVVEKSDVASLEEPSFTNMVVGDIFAMATPSSVDIYVYWDKDKYKLYFPFDIP